MIQAGPPVNSHAAQLASVLHPAVARPAPAALISTLSCLALRRDWNPDLIHVTSPGALPAAGWLYSRLLRVPLVASFHTHVPAYLPRLGLGWLVRRLRALAAFCAIYTWQRRMGCCGLLSAQWHAQRFPTLFVLPTVLQTSGMWAAIRAIHRAAHLTIAVSPATATELVEAGACDRAAVKVSKALQQHWSTQGWWLPGAWDHAKDANSRGSRHECDKKRTTP